MALASALVSPFRISCNRCCSLVSMTQR